MNILRESEIENNIISHFEAVANEGKELLDKLKVNDSLELITAINEYVTAQSKLDLSEIDAWIERALPIGTLWGELYVKELGWEWIKVHFEDESTAMGVFSKDRSVGIYPWHFVLGCIENGATVTILLAWNMLQGGAIPEHGKNSYTNLMDGVHYIIPPI